MTCFSGSDYFFCSYYLIALLSGVVLVCMMISKYRKHVAFWELIIIYVVLSLLVIMGLVTIYAQAHFKGNSVFNSSMLSMAVFLSGVLSYALPRYHRIRFGLTFDLIHKRVFGFAMMLVYACALLIWISSPTERTLLVAVGLACLFAAVGYSHIIYSKYAVLKNVQRKLLIKASVMPLLAFAASVFEGLFFPELTVIYGVTMSLPLIFIAANITIWLFRASLCPGVDNVNALPA